MRQHRNKGSILGFVLVGALLTALVIGGAFVAKRYIAQNQTDEGTVSTTVSDAPSSQATKPNTDDASSENDLQKALEQQSAAEKKAQEQKAASEAASEAASASTAKTTPPPAPSTPADSSNLPQTGYEAPTNAAHLPQTGPAESFLAITGTTLLAASGVAYRRSRALI